MDRMPGVLTHLRSKPPTRESVEAELRERLAVARLHHGFGRFGVHEQGRFVGRVNVRPGAGAPGQPFSPTSVPARPVVQRVSSVAR